MKWLVTLLLSLYAAALSATTIEKINLDNHCEQANFARFGEAIGDARIVMLDELTHGEQQNFALKTCLVRYLHQHQGFDALILESGLFDVAQIWQQPGQAITAQASGNIFYMYAASAPVQALMRYIDAQRDSERPLQLAGFDGRLSGEYSKAQVSEFIIQQSQRFIPSVAKEVDWAAFKRTNAAVLKRQPQHINAKQQQAYVATSYRLQHALNTAVSDQQGYQGPKYVARLLHGLVLVAQSMAVQRRHDEHDLAMADNVKWLLSSELADKKVIIWGHYIHLNYGGFIDHHYANLGTMLKQHFGDSVHSVHISAASGEYRDYVTMASKKIMAQPQQFERQVAQQHELQTHQALFIDRAAMQRFVQNAPSTSVLFGHQYRYGIALAQWQQYWDSLFVLAHTKASKEQP
ncbi:erythromycin esterase family protein [Pseudoalteromonas sp. CNC9-20]|uniref:erythromycin esterase family protein n=1 Tax=Pseudoalteromonas sp. CNC9-20 TaxID=2917750 RepID=UPI001EF563C7|nr:erythromycin esterase family protein [Pseudoalteromonas sp. CNC9-20]MCG7571445.1 erythromycin esterase family protein [Pseudoalteromonas sp. CNC9-20]